MKVNYTGTTFLPFPLRPYTRQICEEHLQHLWCDAMSRLLISCFSLLYPNLRNNGILSCEKSSREGGDKKWKDSQSLEQGRY